MGLDGTFGPAHRAGDLLVSVAANYKVENLPLARRQCCDMSANDVQLALQATSRFVMCKGPFNCTKKVVRRYGLGQKVIRTRLDGPHRGRDVGMAGEEYDRQRRTEFAQALLQFRTTQSGIRTSRRMQPDALSLGKLSNRCSAEA
jgi:hypothetical protein